MYLEVFILIFQLCCLTFCCYCMKMHSKTFLAHFVRCKCINILLWYCIIIISGIGVIIRILTSSTFELNWKTSIEHPFLVVLLYWITFCRPKGRKQESEKTKKVLIQSIATIRSKKMIEFSFSLCVLFKEFSSVTNREKNTTTQKLAKFKFISIIICIHSIAVSGFFWIETKYLARISLIISDGPLPLKRISWDFDNNIFLIVQCAGRFQNVLLNSFFCECLVVGNPKYIKMIWVDYEINKTQKNTFTPDRSINKTW